MTALKLVLSRKGFDSSAGGCPSPILPDGQLLSLPIPDKNSTVAYQDIQHNGTSIGPMVEQLTNGRIPASYRAHLDPDLVGERLPRQRGWRPLFGQTNQAQVHLRNNGVGEGDLFLFFGLFRRTVMDGKELVWDRRSRSVHVLWGWMQVDRVHALGMVDSFPHPWAEDHPHIHRADDPNNTLYTGRSNIDLGNLPSEAVPGASVFPNYKPSLQLTADGAHRATEWELPRWFYPTKGRTPLTYHANRDRWQARKERTRLKAAARGQEFILDCDEYPEAIEWAATLVTSPAIE